MMDFTSQPSELLENTIPSKIDFRLGINYQWDLMVFEGDKGNIVSVVTEMFLRLAEDTPVLYNFRTLSKFETPVVTKERLAKILHATICMAVINFNDLFDEADVPLGLKEFSHFAIPKNIETRPLIDDILK